jgi:hypothetical protein
MKKLINSLLLLAGLSMPYFSMAQKPAVVADSKPGWHRIAGLEASFDKDNESVHIMGNDEFTALRFRVEDAPIHIDRMQVFYESGDTEDIDVKSAMKAGETSKEFQLKYAGRDITKIAFTYKTVDNAKSKKAELEIYGLKTNATAAESYDKKVDEAEGEVKEAAEKTGDEISEAASKAAADIDDKRHDTKVGPNGQVIYIGDDNRFYYINEEGKKEFVTESQLKDK